MLRKFKVEIELCGPAQCTIDDVVDFIETLKLNKDVAENSDLFALGNFDVHDEGLTSIDEWNGDETIVKEK